MPDEETPDTEVVSPEDFDVIDSSRRYILASTRDGYGVWEKDDLFEAVATFPATEDGFTMAQERFQELTRAERTAQGPWPPWIRATVLVALVVWMTLGIYESVVFTVGSFGRFNLPFGGLVAAVELSAFRIWVGGLAAMLAVSVGTAMAPRQRLDLATRVARRLVFVLALGFLTWLVGGLLKSAFPPGIDLVDGEPTHDALNRLALAIDVTGFRLVAGATIGLGISWASGRGSPDAASPTAS